jgi:hypothetical protein
LHPFEDLHGDDVEAGPSIDEDTIDGDVVDGRRAHNQDGPHDPSGDWVIFFV